MSSFNFGTAGGAVGSNNSFLTPVASNINTPATTNNNTLPQGGGAPKLTRFDSSTSATGSAASPFSSVSGQSTLAGLLSAPQTTANQSSLSALLGGSSTSAQGASLFGGGSGTATTATGFGSTLGQQQQPLLGQQQQSLGQQQQSLGQQPSLNSSTGFGFGGGLSASGTIQPSSTAAGVSFSLVPASNSLTAATSGARSVSGLTTSQGLGGLLAAPGAGSGCGIAGSATTDSSGTKMSCDAKAVKEQELVPELRATVDEFMKHVKAQKGVREEIARMSSKPLYLVEEDVKNLRQQLLVVSNSLYRYTSSIEKLKQESTRELHNAEIAQRTHDTPPGLQFENTAPAEYFDRLVCEFETAMTTYRAQIAETEAHFNSVGRGAGGGGAGAPLTPQELSALFAKLNEGFMGLAARLHVVHEAVCAQKEAYINYRKAYHNDFHASDAFDRARKCQQSLAPQRPPTTLGLAPFSSVSSNAAAIAMVSALGRTLTSATSGGGPMPGGLPSLGGGGGGATPAPAAAAVPRFGVSSAGNQNVGTCSPFQSNTSKFGLTPLSTGGRPSG